MSTQEDFSNATYGNEEENKDDQAGGGIGDSIPELKEKTPAPVAPPGGQAVGSAGPTGGPAAAPKATSSGSFQDFSKFKEANKSKLKALGNLSRQREEEKVGGATKALGSAATGASRAMTGQGIDRSSLGKITAGTIGDKTEQIKGMLDKTWDVEAQEAAQENLMATGQEAEKSLGGIEGATQGRAGIQQMLRGQRGGGGVGATAADAMLLQSQAGFRKAARDAAQRLGQDVKQAKTQAESQFTSAVEDTKAQQLAAQNKLRNELGALRSKIQSGAAQRLGSTRQRLAEESKAAQQHAQQGFEDYIRSQMRDVAPVESAQHTTAGGFEQAVASGDQSYNAALEKLLSDPEAFEGVMGTKLGGMFADEYAAPTVGMEQVYSDSDAAALNALAEISGGTGVGSYGGAKDLRGNTADVSGNYAKLFEKINKWAGEQPQAPAGSKTVTNRTTSTNANDATNPFL